MSHVIGVGSIILSIAVQFVFITVNAQDEHDNIIGSIYVVNDDVRTDLGVSSSIVEQEIKLERMKSPQQEFPVIECINVLSSEKGFDVFKVPENMLLQIQKRCYIRDDDHQVVYQLLTDPLQTVICDGVHGAHPDWIVMKLRTSLQKHKDHRKSCAQVDLPHDADLNYLLKDFRSSSFIMSSSAENDILRTTALRVYDGDMEQLVKDRLTLIHLMKVWAPLEPVGFSPLAFTPQPNEDSVYTFQLDDSNATRQFLIDRSDDEDPRKWYTRYNMPVGEMYVWNPTSVAHADVRINELDEEDNVTDNPVVSFRTMFMIVKPNIDFNTLTSSGDETGELCYTQSFYRQALEIYEWNANLTEEALKHFGYPVSCSNRKRKMSHQTHSDQAVKKSRS
uniref:Uncharacterized protein n=1 Tax=Spongospora subterranea TaxID=70186 RepID=A0A0H5QXY3_9EUKA|eukprot:CRZ06607.1 hypothetical protein [Spongospora subterranea]